MTLRTARNAVASRSRSFLAFLQPLKRAMAAPASCRSAVSDPSVVVVLSVPRACAQDLTELAFQPVGRQGSM